MSAHAALWQRLSLAGVVSGDPPADPPATDPWYVTAMVGTAAWIAAVFLLVFVGIGLASLVRSPASSLVVGVVICTGAVVVLRLAGVSLFLRQFAVACSLAGQALVAFGILDRDMHGAASWFGVALFEAALVAAVPDATHRVLATVASAVALRVALIAAGAAWLFAPLLVAGLAATYVASVRMPARDALWSPLLTGIGLTVLLLVPLALVDDLLWYGVREAATRVTRPAASVLLGLAWLAAVAALAHAAGMRSSSRSAALLALGALAVAATAWPVPNVVVAITLLLVAFAGGRNVLAGLAVLAILGALGHAYYALQWSLLAKAAALAATGVVLLAGAALARMPAGAEDSDA